MNDAHRAGANCLQNKRTNITENCIMALTRGVKQKLSRIDCLQAFESGPTVEEPCLSEMADYDHVYYGTNT